MWYNKIQDGMRIVNMYSEWRLDEWKWESHVGVWCGGAYTGLTLGVWRAGSENGGMGEPGNGRGVYRGNR